MNVVNERITISQLAKELNCKVVNLKAPVKRLKTRSIGVGLNPKEVDKAIKYFGADYLIPIVIAKFIKSQYDEFSEIISLDEIIEQYGLNGKDFKNFVSSTLNNNQIYRFLQPNIFTRYAYDSVRRTQVENLVTFYLKSKVCSSRKTKAIVPQFDARTGNRDGFSQKLIEINLLEPIRTATWKQGNVIGFYKRVGQGWFPIIALHNGKICLEDKIKPDPKTRSVLHIQKRNGEKQPVIWNFSINELVSKENADHKLNYLINMLLFTLDKNGVGAEFKAVGDYMNPYIQVITDPVTINVDDFKPNGSDTKKIIDEKTSTFGNLSFEQILSSLKKLTKELGNSIRTKNSNIIVNSLARKVEVAWIPNEYANIMKNYDTLSAKTGIPKDLLLGEAIVQHYDTLYGATFQEATSAVKMLNDALADELKERLDKE